MYASNSAITCTTLQNPLFYSTMRVYVSRMGTATHLSYKTPAYTRFATYCFLCLLSVAIFQIRPAGNADIAVHLLWMTIPFIFTLIFYTVNDHSSDVSPRYVDPSPPSSYTIPLSTSLILLGQIAIWTRTYLGIPPTFATPNGADVQACILHFAMSFWILSECEYIRLYYWHARLRDRPLNLITLRDSIASANFDWTFTVSRDCCSYRVPCQVNMPPRNGWWSLEALFGVPLDFFYIIAFTWVGMVCLVYPVKRFANPDPDGDAFPIRYALVEVFFTPRSYFFNWLDIILQRPVRLVNRMLFELVAEGLKRALDWWRRRGVRGKVDRIDLGSTSEVPALHIPRTDMSDLWVNSEEIAWWAVSRQLYETPWND